jgi:hypothetical protein
MTDERNDVEAVADAIAMIRGVLSVQWGVRVVVEPTTNPEPIGSSLTVEALEP